MHRIFCIAALTMAALLGGCSRQDDESASAPKPQSGLPEDNVFSGQVEALEKAQGVQQTLDAAAAKQREAIERQERP